MSLIPVPGPQTHKQKSPSRWSGHSSGPFRSTRLQSKGGLAVRFAPVRLAPPGNHMREGSCDRILFTLANIRNLDCTKAFYGLPSPSIARTTFPRPRPGPWSPAPEQNQKSRPRTGGASASLSTLHFQIPPCLYSSHEIEKAVFV